MVAAVRMARSWWQKHPVWGWGVIAVLTMALVVGVFVLSANAATERLVPDATVANAWTTIAGATDAFDAINDSDPYDTTSYLRTGGNNQNFTVTVSNPASVSGTVNSVTAYARVRNSSGNNTFRWLYSNGGAVVTDATNVTPVGYAATPSSFVIPPPTGYATWAAAYTADPTCLNNITVGLRASTGVEVTQMYVVVDYTSASAAAVTIGNSVADPAAANIAASQAGVVADRFRIERTAGNGSATVQTLTVHNGGTAACVTAYIYTDANNDGSTAGETLLGSAAFAGADANVNITDQTVGALASPAYYIVVVDVGAATDSQTVVATISAGTGAGAPTPVWTYSDTASTFTVRAAAAVTVGNGTADPAAQDISASTPLLIADRFRIERTANTGSASILTVTVNNAGTSPCTNAYVYTDANNDGGIAGETLLGNAAFAGSNAIIDIADQTVGVIGTPTYYIVCVDVGAGTDGQTVVPTISTGTASGFPAPVVTFSDTANTFTVRVPTTLTIGDGTDPSATPSYVAPGATGHVVDQFSLVKAGTATTTVTHVDVTKTGTAAIAASGVKIFTDANNDGSTSGETQIGSGTFGAGDPATVTIDITDQTVATSAAYYLVTYDIAVGATDGTTATGVISAATYTGATSVTNTDSGAYVITVRVPTNVTLGDNSGSDPAAANLLPSQLNVPVDAFSLQRTQGAGASTVTALTVTKTGAAPIAAVDIYSDANGNGVIDGADASIGTGTFSGNAATIDITDQAIDGTLKYFTVVYDVGAGATDGQATTAEITAATHTNIDNFTESDDAGSTFTVVIPTNVTLGDGANDPASSAVSPGQLGVAVDQFTTQRTQGVKAPTLNSVTVTKTGTAGITAASIYIDANGNGLIDGGDASIGSGNFAGNVATIDIVDQAIDGTLRSYLVVYDVAGTATDGQTTTAEVTSATYSNIDNFTESDDVGATFTVRYTAAVIGDATADPASGSIAPSQTGLLVDRFRIERTAGSQPATVNTVTVTNAGTAPLATAYVYTDTNNDGSIAAETLLGSAAFVGPSAAVNVEPDQMLGALGAPAYYIVVVDVGAATDTQTVIATVASVTGAGTPSPSFTYSDTASTFTVAIAPDSEAPSVPTGVSAVAGVVSPVIAAITWNASTDNIAVTGYKVWRSTTVSGTYAEIGTTNAATLTFNDVTGVTGQQYFYKVSARDAVPNWSALSAASSGVTATWVASALPHATYAVTTKLCKICHDPHVASASMILRGGTDATEASTCYTCHDGTNGVNVKTGAVNSFALASGHAVESASSDPDLTNECSDCHNPHRDYATEPGLPGNIVNGVTIDATPNSWCLACHNATNDWYGAGYPASSAPTVDATGYPTLGTFPTSAGFVAYTGDAANAHFSIPASPAPADPERAQGDCLYCHSSHRSASDYDSLVAAFGAPEVTDPALPAYADYAALCFTCHGGNDYGFATPASDIKQYVTSGGQRSGHRIKTAGGTYDVGSPLPCYECHNAHGSARGNQHMFSDALGQNLDTSMVVGDEHLVREFCFTCHTTPGDVAAGDGLPYGWDSAAGAYVQVSAGSKIVGLARDAAVGANVLRLPETNGHYRADTASCYKCHGGTYGAATANNVHNPSGGVSQGGEPCYNCHTTYQPYMEDGTAPKIGDQRATVYHHVLGGVPGAGYKDGDFAPALAADLTGYPTGFANGIYCLTCHVDHDKFNAAPGSNLRRNATSIADGVPYATNTDFDPTAPFNGGLCTSCHGLPLARDVVDQKAAANPMQSVDTAAYNNSVHQYKVRSEFGAGNTFLADCSKCHNDEQVKEFQTSTNTFGTHWSAEKSLLTALGGTASDPMGETHCYGCHSGNAAGADGYHEQPDYGSGPVDMTKAARSIEVQFGLTSKHPVVPNAGNSVECANCHNPHEVSMANRVSDPANTYASYTYSTDAEKTTFCLKCHSAAASLPTYTVSGSTTLVPSTVTIALGDQAAMNKSANGTKGHWSTTGAISAAEQVNCAECHDNHGSTVVKLLGTYNVVDGKNYIGATEITANTNVVCTACHASASTSFPAGEAQRDANGYPAVGTWPGNAVYGTGYVAGTHTGSPHTAAEATNGYAAGDCKNCHDVHGTAYQYDELTGQFDPTSAGNDQFALCFDCHDGTKGANIAALYPAAAGGSSIGTRAGHRVLSDTSALPGETLSQGESVPCYDCHNPHGSRSAYALQVRDLGDEAGDAFDVANSDPAIAAAQMRHFCFACHVPSDVNEGWADTGAGAGWVALTTETVEGITRTSASYALKLPAITEHTKANANNCMECHSNPHEPTGGVSAGGAECLTCHSDKSAMQADTSVFHHVLDAANPDIAPNAGNTYPTSETDLACVSCHTDHNNFNASKASNLRANINSNSGALVSRSDTDFIAGFGAAGNYDDGICLGCHYLSRTKSASQKVVAGGATETPFIADDGFNASAHQYAIDDPAKVGYDGTFAFKANCSKCHDDEQDAGTKQDGTYAIGTHYSARQHLLASLGGSADANGLLAEEHCYGCHTGNAAGNDLYGAKAMTQAAKSTEAQFALTSKHPVVGAGGDAVECESCHNAHAVQSAGGSRVSDPDNTYNLFTYTDVTNQPAFCLKCHDGSLPAKTVTGATYIPYAVTQTSTAVNNKSDASMVSKGHWTTAGSIAAGERVSCAVCHDNHGSNYPKLLGTYNVGAGTSTVSGAAITGNNKTVCAACHTAASATYAAGGSRDGSGYIADGTWPGMSIYSADAHAGATVNGGGGSSLPAMPTGGDCKVCHDVHGTTNTYDELRPVTTSPATTVSLDKDTFSLCFDCHDTDGPSTKNMKTYYPISVGGAGGGSGHRSATSGGTLTVGDGIPCYDCHNPHGSNAAYQLQVRQYGDTVGEITYTDRVNDTTNLRRLCFLCHSSSDGQIWNPATTAYAAVNATDLVEGLYRDGHLGGGQTAPSGFTHNWLKLKALAGATDPHASTSTKACYDCHGRDYSSGTSNNVHNPSGGASTGGQACYGCHPYQSTMEDGLGTKTGTAASTYYHHVLGGTYASAYNDGDIAPNAAAYPQVGVGGTTRSDVFCVSCHSDHNYFNGSRAGNLRTSATGVGSAVTNTDFPGAGAYGVCVSCHDQSIAKDATGYRKSDGRTNTPIVAGADYDTSAHDYAATSTFPKDSSTFNANCAKCHNDEQTKDWQLASGKTFSTHWSANQHILSALGGANADQLQENECFRCHSESTDVMVGTKKPAGQDWYGIKTMNVVAGAERTYDQFSLTSKHPVVAAGGDSVECESCHNVHEVQTAANARLSDPDNTYSPIAYNTDATQVTFCLRCHDGGALPARTITAATYVPYSVTQANAALNDVDANATKAHWSQSGAIGAGEEVSCAECHDNHGSNAPKLLGVFDTTEATLANASKITNPVGGAKTIVTGNNNTVCAGCHTAATGAAYTRLASGYPNIGTWPGTATYDGANGIHKGAAVKWPGRAETLAGGECVQCHNVHGTGYAYDELVGQFNVSSAGNDRYDLCFNCHDASGPSTRNIEALYGAVDGGSGAGTNAGHKIKTSGGTLAVNQGLPCYDCHNPHGSGSANGLVVESMIAGTKYLIGDAAGEIGDLGTAANVRLFCFTCHTTATGRGTSSAGTAYTNIAATDLVEGISRNPAVDNNALKLSALAAHTEGDTRSCLQSSCHGTLTAASTTNVHSPSSGAGGGPCLGCHGNTSVERLDKMLPTDTTTYHHVLEAANADQMTYDGTPANTELYCLSCHVDHANFNGAAGNLRGAFNDSPTGAFGKDTDFPGDGQVGDGTAGVCLSCHTAALTKSAGGQKSGGSATTPAIPQANYDASAHEYVINSAAKVGYDGTDPFLANCIKCHDDDATGPAARQDGTYPLAPHTSADNRIAQALGAALTGTSTQTEENLCYACHITAAASGTDKKTVAGRDAYDVTNMSAKAEAIYGEMTSATKTNKHNVALYSGRHTSDEGAAQGWNPAATRHVECEDCHNPHESAAGTTASPTKSATRASTPPAIAGATKGVWGVSITGANADGTWAPGTAGSGTRTAPTYSKAGSSSYQWQLCLKCHSSYAWTTTPPNSSVNLANQTGGKQTDVGADFSRTQRSYHPIFTPGLNQPATGLNGAWTSGAKRKWMDLDGDNVNDGAAETNNNGLSNTFTDGWATTSIVVCTDCHNNSDSTGPSGPHASANKWILSGVDTNITTTLFDGSTVTNGSYASANFCINCHRVDVYGTNDKSGLDATAALMSRMNHGRMSSSCYALSDLKAQLQWSSCMHCHGARAGVGSESFNNPANTVVQNGAIHGTSMTYYPTAATYTGATNYMGQRFLNGASWSQHQKGTNTVGCYNFVSMAAVTSMGPDNYSSCTHHTPDTYTELQYSY